MHGGSIAAWVPETRATSIGSGRGGLALAGRVIGGMEGFYPRRVVSTPAYFVMSLSFNTKEAFVFDNRVDAHLGRRACIPLY